MVSLVRSLVPDIAWMGQDVKSALLQVKLRYYYITSAGNITVTIIIWIFLMCPSLSLEAQVQKQTHVSIFTLWGLNSWWYSCRYSHSHQAHAWLNRWSYQNFLTWVGVWRLVQPEFLIQYVFLSVFSEHSWLEVLCQREWGSSQWHRKQWGKRGGKSNGSYGKALT